LVGALEFSIHIESVPHVIAACQPGTFEFRKQISFPKGELDPAMLGKVAEISGMNWTVNGRLSHAIIIKWSDADTNYLRTDKRFKGSIYAL